MKITKHYIPATIGVHHYPVDKYYALPIQLSQECPTKDFSLYVQESGKEAKWEASITVYDIDEELKDTEICFINIIGFIRCIDGREGVVTKRLQ